LLGAIDGGKPNQTRIKIGDIHLSGRIGIEIQVKPRVKETQLGLVRQAIRIVSSLTTIIGPRRLNGNRVPIDAIGQRTGIPVKYRQDVVECIID